MDSVTLALAKAYTNSQRLAYVEPGKVLTYDGSTDNLYGVEFMMPLAKVSDTLLDTATVKKICITDRASGEVTENTAFTITPDTVMIGEDSWVFVVGEGHELLAITGGETGTFVFSFDHAYVSEIRTTETVHPIDPKFLPEGVVIDLNAAGIDPANEVMSAEISDQMKTSFLQGFERRNLIFHLNVGMDMWLTAVAYVDFGDGSNYQLFVVQGGNISGITLQGNVLSLG